MLHVFHVIHRNNIFPLFCFCDFSFFGSCSFRVSERQAARFGGGVFLVPSHLVLKIFHLWYIPPFTLSFGFGIVFDFSFFFLILFFFCFFFQLHKFRKDSLGKYDQFKFQFWLFSKTENFFTYMLHLAVHVFGCGPKITSCWCHFSGWGQLEVFLFGKTITYSLIQV